MNKIKCFLVAVCILCSCAICYWNSSPKVDLYFVDGWSNISNYHMWWVTLWKPQSFTVKFINRSTNWVYINVWFVDWIITNDQYKNRACSIYDDAFGKYVAWNKTLFIAGNSSTTQSYSIELPMSYQYKWNILWCVTLASTDSPAQVWDFDVVARKAYFMDIDVKYDDKTSPTIVSYYPENNSTWVDEHSLIVINFSEPMNAISVKNALQLNWASILDWNYDYTELTISSIQWFTPWQAYHLRLSTWAEDVAGNTLEEHFALDFIIKERPKGWSSSTHSSSDYVKYEPDNCPNWDFSNDNFDGSCGSYSEIEEWHNAADKEPYSIEWSTYSDELNKAYAYAYNLWITTVTPIQKADLMWPLLRKHLAKMISEFAIKVIGLSPNSSKECNFSDTADLTKEMQYYTQISCQLWLMGLHSDWITVKDTFDPEEYVTRAQFGTVLSRMLRWTRYAAKSNEEYYIHHLEALRKNGIMTEIYGNWPNSTELRWRVMVMLKRIDDNLLVSEWNRTIDNGYINVSFNDSDHIIYRTNSDYIKLIWHIDQSEYVSEIHVSHANSAGKWMYQDYKLEKYKPWDSSFNFYAYRWYNSLTINDSNLYKFDFYDTDGKLIFSKTIQIYHNYKD